LFKIGRLHFLVKKNFEFFEIFVVSARTRRIEPVRTKGRGGNFSRFCADIFYGGRPFISFSSVNRSKYLDIGLEYSRLKG